MTRASDGAAVRKRKQAAASNRTRKLARTIVLGAVAVFLAILWLSNELGLDRGELLGFLATSLLLIAIVVLLAMLAAGLIALIRRFLR